MPTFCPVCGYDLALADPDALPEPCPCCAFGFKVFDEPKSYNHFVNDKSDSIFVSVRRTTWAEAHLPWRSRTVPKPEGWDPIRQLKNIGKDWGASYDEWMEKNPVIIPENKDKFLKIAREHLQTLTWRPQFIEALWDGDTQGWFLCISVGAKRADGKYNQKYLWTLRGGGGDFRLFTGTVPPFPEVVIARYLLDEISKEYAIPAHFPAPDKPDDSYADFSDQETSKRCPGCGKAIQSFVGNQCWTCEKRDKQAKKST